MASENSDFFSLEDDEYGDLFITQESNENSVSEVVRNEEEVGVLGVSATDFQSPCHSLFDKSHGFLPHYSDISDDENDFEEESGNAEML